MMQAKKAVVIGSGVAGLAGAIRLALKGYAVTVLEQAEKPGGKLNELWLNGYRFDTGPSLFTLPERVTELFMLAGKNPSDYFQYRKLEEVMRYFWEDGLKLTAFSDPEAFAQFVFEKTGEPKSNIIRYLALSKKKYEATKGFFLERSLHRWQSYFSKAGFKALLGLRLLDMNRPLHNANEQAFQDPRLVQLFDRYATYNGSDPYQAPATLSLIPHLELNLGAYLPVGGMYAITTSLFNLAKDLGVKFRFGERAKRITCEKRQVTGVVTETDALIHANVILSNMDIVPTYRTLLPELPAPEKLLQQERSSSGLIFYWGINRTYDSVGLHNIFFANDYQAEFEALFKTRTIPNDPTVYLNITAKYEPTDAPPNCENWFVMINAPALHPSQTWSVMIENAREAIINKLERLLGQSVRPHIVCEQILTPEKLQVRTSSYLGALYGSSSNNKLSAFFRHPNYSSKLKGLYFAGGSVHPGGGVPLCLLSAKIATDLVK